MLQHQGGRGQYNNGKSAAAKYGQWFHTTASSNPNIEDIANSRSSLKTTARNMAKAGFRHCRSENQIRTQDFTEALLLRPQRFLKRNSGMLTARRSSRPAYKESTMGIHRARTSLYSSSLQTTTKKKTLLFWSQELGGGNSCRGKNIVRQFPFDELKAMSTTFARCYTGASLFHAPRLPQQAGQPVSLR